MARSPTKTCPNLSRLFDDAEASLLSAFLDCSAFDRLTWLDTYRSGSGNAEAVNAARDMLEQEKKANLSSLETEAARVVTIAGNRGQYSLEGLAGTKLGPDRLKVFQGQRDELARSLWTYIHETALFDAAESNLHLRLYRRYDKHYQTFPVDPPLAPDSGAGERSLDLLLKDLGERLDRGEGYDIDRFDIPADGDEPAAEMYLLFHPNPPTSVREIDDEGNRSRIYFRPPGEAMVVYTPSTGRVHVRAGTRHLRHAIAESFIETVLQQPPSRQPVDFQGYDISRFFEGFDLALPDFGDVAILCARIIRADVSVVTLANRLSLSTTVDRNMSDIIASQPGLGNLFERAVAIRFIEIAVQHRREGRDSAETLNITLTDRNTSSLLSLGDPFERTLGHRLLRHWGILHEGRAPDGAEAMAVLPALLDLWDIGAERVSGAWLQARSIDPTLLTELGFLVPAGWDDDDMIDDEDSLGPVAADVVLRPEGPDLCTAAGQAAPAGSVDRYRLYRVRDEWVAQHLRQQLTGVLDVAAVEVLNGNILALGTLWINDRDVPVYLVRSLDDERIRAAIDTELRARVDRGIGLVVQAGRSVGQCLAANVLTPAIDHLESTAPGLSLSADSLRAVFRRHRILARGGLAVELTRVGDTIATLFVPGKGSIDIEGNNRIEIIQRLVDAHNAGPMPMATKDLVKGIAEDQSLSNILSQPLWSKLQAAFVRSPRKGKWEIDA